MNAKVDKVHPGERAPKTASSAACLVRSWQDLHCGQALGWLLAPRSWLFTVTSRKQNTPSPSKSRAFGRLWAGQIAVCILIATVTALLVGQLRQRALSEADYQLQSLSLILADQAERAFEAVDLVQTMFLSVVQAESIESMDAFRERMSSLSVNKEMNDHGCALPQLDVIGVVDANGDFVNVSHVWPTPKVNIADRPHFKALKADPDLATFVSDPMMNRLTHTMAVVVAHRISSPNHTFLGISFAGVLMSYFEKLYQTVATQPEMSITLLRQDGVLLVHYPHAAPDAGRPYVRGELAARMARTGVDHDVMQVISPLDGLPRLVAGHTLARYLMLVTVSRTISAILAPWREQAADLVGAAILLELVIAAVVMLMRRHFRAQSMLAEAHAARRAAEAEVELAQERERAVHERHVRDVRFGAALDNMSQALCMFNPVGGLVVANRRVAGLFGLPDIEIAPDTPIDSVRQVLAGQSNLRPADIDAMETTIAQLQTGRERSDSICELSDGRSLSMNFAPMEDEGWLVTWEDITERRRIEARIAYMAHHDALTGLANRILFQEKLQDAVARSRRQEISAVLFLDLDHFKAVNDTMGHPAGDALLKEVTRRLLQEVRETDTVARLGGDEFAIVQTGIRTAADATALAERVIEAISAPYQLDGQKAVIGTSVGIAVIPHNAPDASELLKNADMALYRAKEEGRGRFRYFEPEMDTRIQERRALEQDLRNALARDEFEVFYQPVMNLETQSVCGFEALLRWHHPDKGLVLPSAFIPVAEEIGLIVPLGDWVLRQACCDAMTWPGRLKVAVNLSPVQFTSPTLVTDITASLEASGLEPDRLELEITELAMLTDTERVLTSLNKLRDRGVRIALDDFGTGYSSLSYVQRFSFNKAKIDRMLIEGLGNRSDCDILVAAIVNLCESLGMTTTAEGVETKEQLQQLSKLHCTEGQGYLFSRPCPAGKVLELCTRLSQAELAATS